MTIPRTLAKPFDELTPQELANRKHFDCGEPSLNNYLMTTMRKHDEKSISKSYLCTKDNEIVGYYTLLPSVIDLSNVAPEFAKKNKYPEHSLPVILLARLAVSIQYQKQGYADLMMAEIILKSAVATKSIGGVGLAVDALHQPASDFYQKYGFSPSPDNPLLLFMSLKQ
jgi:predicted N-acetyltransferase YhbS